MLRERGGLRAALASLARAPLKLMIVAAVFSNVVREFFPFSYFPMYSRMGPASRYLYVTDLDGAPIALQTETGTRTAFLKRAHRSYYRKELARLGGDPEHRQRAAEIAGEQVMRWLIAQSPEPQQLRQRHEGLRLVGVDLERSPEGSGILRSEEILTEVSLR